MCNICVGRQYSYNRERYPKAVHTPQAFTFLNSSNCIQVVQSLTPVVVALLLLPTLLKVACPAPSCEAHRRCTTTGKPVQHDDNTQGSTAVDLGHDSKHTNTFVQRCHFCQHQDPRRPTLNNNPTPPLFHLRSAIHPLPGASQTTPPLHSACHLPPPPTELTCPLGTDCCHCCCCNCRRLRLVAVGNRSQSPQALLGL